MARERNELQGLLEAAEHALNAVVFAIDPTGKITYRGGQAVVAAGLAEGLGRSYHEVFADSPMVIARLDAALAGESGTWSVSINQYHWDLHLLPRTLREGVASGVYGVLENTTQRRNTIEEIRWRTRELAALNALSAEVSSSLDFAEVVSTLRVQLQQRLNLPAGVIFLLGFHSFTASQAALWNVPEDLAARAEKYTLSYFDSLSGVGVPGGWSGDVTGPHPLPDSTLFAEGDLSHTETGFESGYVVPLLARGQFLGVLFLFSPTLREFDMYHPTFPEMLGHQVGAALQNARLYDALSTSREEMQVLTHRLVSTHEEERCRLARELHDELGQMLTGLRLSLNMAVRDEASVEERDARHQEAQSLVSDLLTAIRRMTLELRPTILDDLGLFPALRAHFERYEAQTGIRVSVSHDGIRDCRFPRDTETAAYRIVQEALTNVARHANTDQVWVDVRAENGRLRLLIEDAGRGFTVHERHTDSSGLSGMRERATALGGWCSITSDPGNGTRVEASLHLPALTALPSGSSPSAIENNNGKERDRLCNQE